VRVCCNVVMDEDLVILQNYQDCGFGRYAAGEPRTQAGQGRRTMYQTLKYLEAGVLYVMDSNRSTWKLVCCT